MSSVRSTAQHSNVKWPSSGASWQSQQLGHTENWQQKPMKASGKSHSWWWDSHISPKNSKWLEDNLNAMDAKVKAMLKLIEEDADSFAKRAEMYYKKRPELVSLVEEFYRSYRSLAERYDQLTGDIRKNVPHDMQAQFGLSGDSSPGSPFASNVRRRAAGFNVFASPGTPTRSQESFDDKEVGESVSSRQESGYDESSSSSSSESEHETNSRKKRQEELRELRKENDQLMKDLHNGTAEHNALLKRVSNLQVEINTLKQENSRLQEGTSAAASRANMLRDEVENLQKGNAGLGHEVALRVDQLEKLQKDLSHSQEEERRLLKQLDEVSLREQNSEVKINQLTEELRALKVELDKLQQAKSDLTNEVSTGVEQVLKLKDEVKWLQEALSRSDSEKVKSIALQELLLKQHEDLQMQVSALQEEKKKLCEEILSEADKVRSLEEQLEQLQGGLLSSEGEKSKGLELLREMEVGFERLQNDFSTMQESLNGQISMHVSGKRDLQDQLQQHLEALTSLQNEKSRCVDFQEVLQKRLGDVQQERDLAKDETCKLRDEMAALMDRLEGEILSRDKLVNHLNDQLSTKQDENQILRKKMEDSAEEIKTFQGAVQKLQNSLNNSQKENQILESKLQVTLESSSKLTEEVTEMRRLIEIMKGEQAAADAYKQKIDHDIDMLMREKTGLTEERLLNVDHINKLGHELQGMIGKLSEKERVVLEVESEVRRLQETNLRMESELSSKMEHAQQLELRIESLEDVVDLTQVANTKLSSDLQESLAQMQSAEERCRQQEQMLLQLQEERMQLSVEMEDIRTREKGLQGERDLLLVEKSKLEAQVNEFKQLVARLQDEIQVLRNQNEDLRIKVQRHTETEQVLDVEIQKLRDELFNLQHVGEDKMRLSLMQISQLKEEIYRLELQSTDSSARLKLLGEEQESWNQERSRLHNEIDNLTEENRQLQCTLLERTDHHQKLKTEHDDLKKRTRDVEDSLVFYRTENDRSQADIAAKVERILRLEQELSMMENSLSASQENIKNLSFQFENEIQELNDRLRAEIEKVQLLGEDTQKLQEALLNAQKETQMVKDSCKQHLMEFKLTEESMESQIVKLTNGIGLLEDESKELDKRLQDKRKQQEALELDIENLQGAVLRTTKERESMKAECDRQLKELVEERENRTRLEEANANLQIETKDLYVEIAQLQAQLHWMHGKIEELKKRGEAAVDQERKVELEIYSLLLALKNVQVENGSFRDEYNGYMEELRSEHLSLKSIEESIQSLLQEMSQSKQDGVLHSGRIKEELDRGLERAGQPVESYSRRDKNNILWKELQALQSQIPALEQQLESLEEKKSKVREQFFVHLKHSDAASSVLQREKKELHEKLLIEGDRVLKLQEELRLIREEDDKSKVGIDAANLQIQKLLRDLQELQQTLQRKEQQEKYLKDELESHVQEHLKVVNGLNESQIALSLERAECWNLRDQMALKDQEARKLDEEIALLKEHFAKLEEEKDTLVGEKERVFKQIKDFERKTEELQEELLMLREQRKCLEEKLEAELVCISAFEEESSNWQQEKDSLTSHITVHVNKTMKLLEQIGQVTEEKEKLSGKLQVSESIIESLIEESNVVSQKYETVEKELKNLQMQLAHLQDENRRLGQDVSLRTASIAELKDIVSCLEKEKSEIESEVQIKQEHVLILEERIGGLQEENEQLKEKLISGTEQMQILHEEISKLQQLHVNLQSEHETLKHDKQRDFDEYSAMVMRLEKVQQDLSLQQTDNTHLKAELTEGAARIEELEAKICQHQMEKQALSVEIASTASLMNDLQSKYDSLQEHVSQMKHDVESGKEELQKKNEEIQKLLSLQESLREENKGLSAELERKIKDSRIVEDTLRGFQEEHRSLQDRNQELSEEVASGGRLIDRLKQEAEQLRADREARDHEVLLKEDQIHHLQKGTHMLQQSEEQLRHLVQGKDREIQGLEEEIQRLKDALFSTQEKSSKEKVKLETEVKKLEADVNGLRGEKVTLGDEYKLSIDRCNVELEQLCKRMQQELVEHQEDRTRLEAEVEELKEKTKVLGDGITSKQGALDSMQSTNEHLNNLVSELKGEIRNLQTELSNLQNEHRSLETQLSSKVLLVQELELALSSLKEKVLVFQEGTTVAIGDVFAVQDEVTKLIQRITRLNEHATQGETLLDEERKKSSEMLANVTTLQQELAFLREENKRQRTVIFDRGEEKREAIRQLCITLEFYQDKNRRLEGVISSIREKIQKRVAVGRRS